jgi:hypothetical protein
MTEFVRHAAANIAEGQCILIVSPLMVISQALLECEPETMAAFLDHLAERHGGVVAYLAAIGVNDATVTRLRARLVDV